MAQPLVTLNRSGDQLEQLVGEQGDDPEHQMKLDLLGSPHHDVAGPEIFFQMLKRSATELSR